MYIINIRNVIFLSKGSSHSQWIQQTDPMISLRSSSWHFTCANRQKGFAPILVPNFFVNESLLHFEDSRYSVALIVRRQNSTSNPDRASTLLRLLVVLKRTNLTPQHSKHSATLPPNRFFFHLSQILPGHVTSHNQVLSSNDEGRHRSKSLGTRLMHEARLFDKAECVCFFSFGVPKVVLFASANVTLYYF